ncbi:DUF3301 domain-containing protein [Catenovulum sp. 2E275]|uniref:DUF3301 domain-containing protein n=1 Tax=Catenovulum sp. 2E275 TaxID=2980497 RepID=UPI0021D25FAC|nr:DUF3301 domain-containing protein [Catenovulum sp. 2E275]MCU4676958.1 DUF3301 domain-containing protein [Catenovulum sp. 2E275]
MQLIDIVILIGLFLVGFQFWQLRKQTEAALAYANNYCEQNNLQFISLARKQTKIKLFKKKLIEWQSEFEIEFSGNGEDSSLGFMQLQDMRLVNITTQAYPIN